MIRMVYGAVFALCGVILGIGGPAFAASSPVPRLALVIGEGTYANATQAPKITAVNDAGLISFQLQQAGFDVTGGADVDRQQFETLAATFIAKLGQAGPNAVAVIYISGFGLQSDGDNRIVPTDARLATLDAVATETISMNELLAQFQTVPAATRIAIVDISRPLPFAVAAQVAPGLAALNPVDGLLVAFSQQPGYVTQEGSGAYSAYASALADAMRAPGLPLDSLFARTRLRVQQETNGGQMPWNVSGLSSDFTFFQAEASAPPPAQPVRNRPIRGQPMPDAFAVAIERDTIEGYQEFVGAYPNTPLARRAQAIIAARREAFYWQRTTADGSPRAYWTYLRHYGRGPHADEARGRLQALRESASPPPGFADEAYDIPPPPPDEDGYYVPARTWYEQPPPPPPPAAFLPPAVFVYDRLPPPRYDRRGFLPQPVNPVPLPPRIIPVPVPVVIVVPSKMAPLPLAVPPRAKPTDAGKKLPPPQVTGGQPKPAGTFPAGPTPTGPKPTGPKAPNPPTSPVPATGGPAKPGVPGSPGTPPGKPGTPPVAPNPPTSPVPAPGGPVKPGAPGTPAVPPGKPGTPVVAPNPPTSPVPPTGGPVKPGVPVAPGSRRGKPGAQPSTQTPPTSPPPAPGGPITPGAKPDGAKPDGNKPDAKPDGAKPRGAPPAKPGTAPKTGPAEAPATPVKPTPAKPDAPTPQPKTPPPATAPKPQTTSPAAPKPSATPPARSAPAKPEPKSGPGGAKRPCPPAEHADGKC